MGPFPHDAPPATISADNPMGTDGFEFVEYAHPKPQELHALFKLMGYVPVARHKTKKITVYRQGDINYLVNEEPGTHGFDFVAAHGPCAPSMAFRVVDAQAAYERALVARRGAGRCVVRAEDARRARDQGHRRQPALFRRSLRRQGLGLRCRVRVAGRTRSAARRRRPVSISITSPTTSIAAAWMSGPASTKNCSTSARSASSTSRAAPPACSRAR